MIDRELGNINESGELLNINLTAATEANKLLQKQEVEALIDIGKFSFSELTMYFENKQRINIDIFTVNDQGDSVTFTVDPNSTTRVKQLFLAMSNEDINAAGDQTLVNKSWVESKVTGATGSFTAQSGETITVTNGLITAIE